MSVAVVVFVVIEFMGWSWWSWLMKEEDLRGGGGGVCRRNDDDDDDNRLWCIISR